MPKEVAAFSIEPFEGSPSRADSLLFALLCLFPVFAAVLFGGVDAITWAMVPLLWAGVVLIWLFRSWYSGGLVLNTDALLLPLLGLILIGVIQLLPLGGSAAGGLVSTTISSALTLDPYATRLFLIKLVVYLTFFAACLTFINSEGRLKKTVALIVIFGTVLAFIGILQRLSNPDAIYGLRETPHAEPFGPFVNQHHFASFMQMTSGLAAAMLLGVEGREKKALLGFALALMAIGTVWTGSRGGLIGFVSVMVFVGVASFFNGKDEKAAANGGRMAMAIGSAAFLFVVLGAMLFLGGADRMLRSIGINNPSGDITTGRAHYWSVAWQIFLDHPVIGAGLEAFGVAYPHYDTLNGTLHAQQAHNDYLQTLSDAGVIGLVMVAAFIVLLFSKGLKMVQRSTGFRRAAAAGSLAGCFGILVHSFFDFPLRTPSNAFFFLMLTAVAVVPVVIDEQKPHRRHRRG
jgi:O-antigen ligase